MDPQQLLALQARIGRSFLQAFMPAEKMSMNSQERALNQNINKENQQVRSAEVYTANISRKLVKVLGLVQEEINELLASLDSLQQIAGPGEIVLGKTGDLGDAVSSIDIDLWRTRRKPRKNQAEEEEKARKAKEEEKAKKAEEEEKAKKAQEEKAKAQEEAKAKTESDSKVKAETEAKTSSLAESKPAAPSEMPKPPTATAESLAEAAGKGEAGAAEAFKNSLKSVEKPESILSLLKKARNAAADTWINKASASFISKILGNRLVSWGFRIAAPILEGWEGWNEYMTANHALSAGLITQSQYDNVVRYIIVQHSARTLIGLLVAEIAGSMGAAGGATAGTFVFPGLGTAIGGIAGGLVGGTAGWFAGVWAADLAVDLFLGKTSLSNYLKMDNGDADVTPPQPEKGPDATTNPAQSATLAASTAALSLTPKTAQDTVKASPSLSASMAAGPIAGSVAGGVNPPSSPTYDGKHTIAGPVSDPGRVAPPTDVTPPPSPPLPQTQQILNQAEKQVEIRNQTTTLAPPGGITPDMSSAYAPGGEKETSATLSTRSDLGAPISAAGTLGTAKQFLGRSEGRDRDTLNQFISQYFAPFDVQRQPWCSAFTNAVLGMNGLPGTGSAMAKSFLGYGQEVWSPRNPDARNVSPGDIAVFDRGGDKGHVAFVEAFDGNTITVLGGNQSDASGGGGAVTESSRSTSSLLSIRRAAFAEGGVVHAPTLALIGEAGEPEYVVPHSKVGSFAAKMLEPTIITKRKKHTHTHVIPILL